VKRRRKARNPCREAGSGPSPFGVTAFSDSRDLRSIRWGLGTRVAFVPNHLLALTGTEWIGLAGVAAGALGTIGGLVFAHLGRRAEHEHARELSRSQRLHAQRQDAYVQVAAFLERSRLWAFRTEPFWGPQPEPPEPANDEEFVRLSALIAVAGSPEVQEKVRDATSRLRIFEITVGTYRDEGYERVPERRRELEGARTAIFDSITEAEEAMRDELAEP
jgi:hypothetical protein